MAASPFIVTEHMTDCQYIREYPRATTTQNAPLKLLIKKYTPKNNPCPQPGDVTLIGTHGSGLPKELYEPLWEEILARSEKDGFRIRAIWIADISNQGASGVYNERYLGNDPSWQDHSRDLLQMINHFQADMPQPIVGIGHSMGGVQQIFLSSIHPRLLYSLVLIEPWIIERKDDSGRNLVAMRTKQKGAWASWSDAVKDARTAVGRWDSRVVDRWFQYGYRDLSTAEGTGHGSSKSLDSAPSIALTTTIPQEVFMYLRPNFRGHTELGLPDIKVGRSDNPSPPHDALLVPDLIGDGSPLFYRSEPRIAWRLIPHLRPSVLYISGAKSPLSQSGHMAKAVAATGVSVGGSGGVPQGRVKHISIEKSAHTVPLEKVAETASEVGPWISQEVQRWKEDELRIAKGWEGLSRMEKSSFSDEFMTMLEKSKL